MKVIHVCSSDLIGGAARAAYRIHRGQVASGIRSTMRVIHKVGDDPLVRSGPPVGTNLINTYIKKKLSSWSISGFRTDNKVWHSSAWPDTGLGKELNASSSDIINLHWLGQLLGCNVLSVEEIGRLTKPIVWTLHDMWPFCGAEHYSDDNKDSRYRLGYSKENCPIGEREFDLNQKVWRRKLNSWVRPMYLVCPSKWMAGCVRKSVLFRNASVSVIPIPININKWHPVPKQHARQRLDINPNSRVILFGAPGGLDDPRKGGDLLFEAISRLQSKLRPSDELLIFGESKSETQFRWPIQTRFMGHLDDDTLLKNVYSAADVFVMPSRQEAFGQTALESMSCGTAVAAFDTGGLSDMIQHRKNGWLAQPFDTQDLANGIAWLLTQQSENCGISNSARRNAVDMCNEERVAGLYLEVYKEIMSALA